MGLSDNSILKWKIGSKKGPILELSLFPKISITRWGAL